MKAVDLMEKALLVGLDLPTNEYSIDYTLKELGNLAKACDLKVIEKISQKTNEINPKYYVGSGKVDEIKMLITSLEIDVVIFDDELSPSQIRNLESKLECRVIDRSLLILDIFSQRANTAEAILEIKLARLTYMLPRLIGLNASLSRQGGGSGATSSKGAGEKQLELDRRQIMSEIEQTKRKLQTIKNNRQQQRQKRSRTGIPIISLVGYTNAGKSSTFNTLVEACKSQNNKEVLEKDMLFATLGTNVRKLTLPNKQEILLIDTVGFVSKLPTLLVNSFRSTLEEIINSSLILHVVDISNTNYENQIKVTNEVLAEIGVHDIPSIYLLNKCDKVEEVPTIFNESIAFSNKQKTNLDLLIKTIERKTKDISNTLIDVKIPLTDGKTISVMEAYGIIEAKIYTNEYIYYKAYVPNNLLVNFNKYLKIA